MEQTCTILTNYSVAFFKKMVEMRGLSIKDKDSASVRYTKFVTLVVKVGLYCKQKLYIPLKHAFPSKYLVSLMRRDAPGLNLIRINIFKSILLYYNT